MSNKSSLFTKVAAALVLSLAMVTFVATYLTQAIGAQVAKESGFRVTKNVSCAPDQTAKEEAHFSGCSSII
jgi:uncharacterized membrane protein